VKKAFLFVFVPMGIGIVALTVYLSGGRFIISDNAYVRSGIAMVSAANAGYVHKVLVVENQQVNVGEVLFVLEVEPFDLAINQAMAMLEDARLEVKILKADYQGQQTRLTAAIEDQSYAEREFKRVQKLTSHSAVSEEKVATRLHEKNMANNRVVEVEADIVAALTKLGGKPNLKIDQYPKVKNASGELARTQLDRRRAEVKAGISGIVAKINLYPGEFVQKGQPVFSLVHSENLWVEANLKETQVTHLRVGQKASFEIDAFPGTKFTGVVESIAPASGAEFAILPPQNATGNWVKITQRIPVRLRIDKNSQHLRSGMSLTVNIDTQLKRSLKDLVNSVSLN